MFLYDVRYFVHEISRISFRIRVHEILDRYACVVHRLDLLKPDVLCVHGISCVLRDVCYFERCEHVEYMKYMVSVSICYFQIYWIYYNYSQKRKQNKTHNCYEAN